MTTKLIPAKSDNGTVVYIEIVEDIFSDYFEEEELEEADDDEDVYERRGAIRDVKNFMKKQVIKNLTNIEDIILGFSESTLEACKKINNGNVNKVTLEFGLSVGSEVGFYVTKGTVASNLKVMIECSIPTKTNPS